MLRRTRLYAQQLRSEMRTTLHELAFGPTEKSGPCKCGCPYTVHRHFRPGTNCGKCGEKVCPRYRRKRNLRPVRS